MIFGPSNRTRPISIVANLSLAVLATFFVIARIVAKHMRRLAWTWDDTLLAIGLVCLYMLVAGSVIAVTIGHAGQHIYTAPEPVWRKTLQLLFTMQFPQVIAMTATRCSCALMFLRIFFTRMFPKLRFTAYLYAALSIAWFVVQVLFALLHCRPIVHNWTMPLENPKYCFPAQHFKISMVAGGLVIDAVLWSMPHFVVWSLQLRRAHKIAITAMFALGVLNIIMAVLRIVSIADLDYDGDITYKVIPAMIWTVAQTSTAIILTCCPLLRPLFEKLIPSRLYRMGTYVQQRPAIQVTTRIAVHADTSVPRTHTPIRDVFNMSEGPQVRVETRRSTIDDRTGLC